MRSVWWNFGLFTSSKKRECSPAFTMRKTSDWDTDISTTLTTKIGLLWTVRLIDVQVKLRLTMWPIWLTVSRKGVVDFLHRNKILPYYIMCFLRGFDRLTETTWNFMYLLTIPRNRKVTRELMSHPKILLFCLGETGASMTHTVTWAVFFKLLRLQSPLQSSATLFDLCYVKVRES